ncbi:hypothetical protein [Kaarinaea lacus]
MTAKARSIRKPLYSIAIATWVSLVFIKEGIAAGIITVFLILVVLTAMNVEH